jgi:hypothetical protein
MVLPELVSAIGPRQVSNRDSRLLITRGCESEEVQTGDGTY